MADPNPQTQVSPDALEALEFQRYRLRGTGGGKGQSYDRRMVFIGSAPDNDFVVEHPTVSRVHARLEFDGAGYLLRDLGSKNGTWVDGVRVREAFLPGAAKLRFGHAEVGFALEEDRVHIELTRAERLGKLLGRSPQMREIFALIPKVAKSNVPVLIEGESGTGKELVAEAIQQHSTRAERPFIVFDCSAVPPDLAESELFGHVRGAFTGAVATRSGVFEQAHGGTIFLDEIGELPLDLQPKLLRALEKGEIKAVGDSVRKKVDVRVIAATNRVLDKEVEAGNFREDLYYRLAVIKVRLPALRHRPEDVPLLVEHFLAASGSSEVQVGWETMRRLQQHPWPGNVRELKNYVDRAVVLAEHGRLETRHLSTRGMRGEAVEVEGGDGERLTLGIDIDLPFKDAKGRLLDVFETKYWQRLLEKSGGNISEASRRGGIHRKSLEYIVKKLDLKGD
ncbi:MAG: sigma 54-interacting transcriptional regulator [Deltaproteobacteria bacterium]|nr:sigma 54-interacting transcriptional regulator [Deltaproteobacteria bacterium]